MIQNLKNFLANLPHNPGVYQMLDSAGKILYVGKARDLKKRIASYFVGNNKDIKTSTLVKLISDVEITVTHNEIEAVLLECNLIKKHHPRYNVLLRDDKSYPYILITTEHPFPRIDLYRGKRKKKATYFGPYPSAYAVRETISVLQKIFKLRTCSDSFFATRKRPCLLYQINRCTGPCVGNIDQENYLRDVNSAINFLKGKANEVISELQKNMEEKSVALDYEGAAHLRDQIARLQQIRERQYINVTEGDVDILGFADSAGVICIQLLAIRGGQILGSKSYFPAIPLQIDVGEILSAFISQHYLGEEKNSEIIPKSILVDHKPTDQTLLAKVLTQQAKHKVTISKPIRGEKRKWMEMATTNAKQSLAVHVFNKSNLTERLQALQRELQLSSLPERIECFDVSHSMGEATVASCVVFNAQGPVKNDYRRFNIKDITAGDDVAGMRQVIFRRFKRLQKEGAKMPDIAFIDGGMTQLQAARNALLELNVDDILLIGVAKGPERKPGFETLYQLNKPPMHLPADSLALHFIQQIRDEAHRFAITGHRQQRDKKRKTSTLEAIPGIGAKRRRELLRYFGGIQGLRYASLEELAKVPGISRSLAERIFTMLHDATL